MIRDAVTGHESHDALVGDAIVGRFFLQFDALIKSLGKRR
jgi:hypothetical protein